MKNDTSIAEKTMKNIKAFLLSLVVANNPTVANIVSKISIGVQNHHIIWLSSS